MLHTKQNFFETDMEPSSTMRITDRANPSFCCTVSAAAARYSNATSKDSVRITGSF